ncbi:MAG: hypothetical protein IKQ35_02130 [Bacilli bacterium]|nr:hypothetical protein [Bacilli bacterium]
MTEYALKNFALELEKIRTGKKQIDEYDMDLSGVFPKYEEKEYDNPYFLDLTDIFLNGIELNIPKEEKNNPYLLDLTNVFKDGIELRSDIDLSTMFPEFHEVQYNPYTMDIKSLSRKEEIHIKQKVSHILENYIECELKNSKQEQEAVDIILEKYGISMKRIKSGRPSIVKIGNILYVPIDYLERIERIFRQNNIVID